jgi:hypothetical protein
LWQNRRLVAIDEEEFRQQGLGRGGMLEEEENACLDIMVFSASADKCNIFICQVPTNTTKKKGES